MKVWGGPRGGADPAIETDTDGDGKRHGPAPGRKHQTTTPGPSARSRHPRVPGVSRTGGETFRKAPGGGPQDRGHALARRNLRPEGERPAME